MIVTGANPASTNPNTAQGREALKALDLLVVRDLFMTETAALADYVLPAASFLERTELHAHAKHQIVSVTRKVVSWPDVQGEYEFWHDLARRLGIGEYFPWEDETALNRWLLEPTGLTLEELAAHPEGVEYSPARPRRWEADGFATPSGKVEFASSYLKDLGYDELPVYRSPAYRTSAPTRRTRSCSSRGRASSSTCTAASATSPASSRRSRARKWRCTPTMPPLSGSRTATSSASRRAIGALEIPVKVDGRQRDPPRGRSRSRTAGRTPT